MILWSIWLYTTWTYIFIRYLKDVGDFFFAVHISDELPSLQWTWAKDKKWFKAITSNIQEAVWGFIPWKKATFLSPFHSLHEQRAWIPDIFATLFFF